MPLLKHEQRVHIWLPSFLRITPFPRTNFTTTVIYHQIHIWHALHFLIIASIHYYFSHSQLLYQYDSNIFSICPISSIVWHYTYLGLCMLFAVAMHFTYGLDISSPCVAEDLSFPSGMSQQYDMLAWKHVYFHPLFLLNWNGTSASISSRSKSSTYTSLESSFSFLQSYMTKLS